MSVILYFYIIIMKFFSKKFFNRSVFTLLTLIYIFIVNSLRKSDISARTLQVLGLDSPKVGKLIIFFIVTTTFITFNGIFLRKILIEKIPDKISQPGIQGIRGLRGKTGKSSKCTSCNDNSVCYKKIMKHITNTINWWRTQIIKQPALEESYLIKNEYIRSKINRQCRSKQFLKILNKFGSNQKDKEICGKLGESCGSYDYMYRMWTIWILTILKYKNGFFFLESPKLNESDFIGLIEPSDVNTRNNSDWNRMFEDSKGLFIQIKKDTEIIPKNGKYEIKIHFNSKNLNKDFFTNFGVPLSNGKALSPFEEIKKYKSWYWGSDPELQPKMVIVPKNENINDPHSLCNSCINFYKDKFICDSFKFNRKRGKGRIKVIRSNHFYKLFETDVAAQKKVGSMWIPFERYGSSNVTFMRANDFINENDHFMFREYKPIGDVVFESENVKKYEFAANKCLPSDLKYKKKLIDRKVQKNMSTILVSGDVKHPTDYKLLYTTITRNGINKNITSLSVWQPKAPKGYLALGHVIDTTPYKAKKPRKPPLDLIVCLPEECCKKFKDPNKFNKPIWNNEFNDLESNGDDLFRINKLSLDIVGDPKTQGDFTDDDIIELDKNELDEMIKDLNTFMKRKIIIRWNNLKKRKFIMNTFYGTRINQKVPTFWTIKPQFICIKYDRFKHNYDDIDIEIDNCKNKETKYECNKDIKCKYDDKRNKCTNNYNYDEIKNYSIMKIYE